MNKSVLGFIFLILSYGALANVSHDLEHYFNNLGFGGNVTSPEAFESQAAGFFGGGSLYARGQVRQYQLVELDLPDYRAGCGGIDLFMGSLSFLNEQKLVDLGKSIMSNAGAYAADVMLATTVPQLKGVRDNLQHIEQNLNQASINSCELSQNFVGGLWPKTIESQKKICKDQGTMGQDGLFSDYVKGRMECNGSGFHKALMKAEQDKHQQKEVVYNKNIVWSLLQTKEFFKKDKELSELVMSLTGTLIFHKNGTVRNVPSLLSNQDLVQVLIGRGSREANIWRCEDSTCLRVTLKPLIVQEKSTLNYRIKEKIESIHQKIKNDIKESSDDKSFAALVSLPVVKFLSVALSTEYGNASVDMTEFSELIAQDLLTNYLNGLLNEINEASSSALWQEDLVKSIQKRIQLAINKVNELDPKVSQKLNQKLQMIEHFASIEKTVAATMGSSL